jgi:hypothetical protein
MQKIVFEPADSSPKMAEFVPYTISLYPVVLCCPDAINCISGKPIKHL